MLKKLLSLSLDSKITFKSSVCSNLMSHTQDRQGRKSFSSLAFRAYFLCAESASWAERLCTIYVKNKKQNYKAAT